MALPKVSVVVTVKNEEENIATLLDSLLKQDYSGEVEVLVVDGGSNDKTIGIVSTYPNVKLITAKCNVSQGRNIGIENSSGEIIAFTDGDCVAYGDWIRNIVKHFAQSSEIAAVGGPYSSMNQHGLIPQYLAIYEGALFPSESGFTTYQHIGTGNVAFRREVIEKVGGFDEGITIGEDTDLNLRVSNLGYKLFFAKDVKVYHKFRTTLGEASEYAFDHGKAYSLFNRRHKKYRELLFPRARTLFLAAGVLLIVTMASGNLILAGIELVLLLTGYYFYKLIFSRRKPHQPRTSLKTKLALPLIDLHIRLLDSLGSIAGLLKATHNSHSTSQLDSS